MWMWVSGNKASGESAAGVVADSNANYETGSLIPSIDVTESEPEITASMETPNSMPAPQDAVAAAGTQNVAASTSNGMNTPITNERQHYCDACGLPATAKELMKHIDETHEKEYQIATEVYSHVKAQRDHLKWRVNGNVPQTPHRGNNEASSASREPTASVKRIRKTTTTSSTHLSTEEKFMILKAACVKAPKSISREEFAKYVDPRMTQQEFPNLTFETKSGQGRPPNCIFCDVAIAHGDSFHRNVQEHTHAHYIHEICACQLISMLPEY